MERVDGVALVLIVLVMVLAESLVVTDLLVPGEVGLVVAGAAAAGNGTPIVAVIAAAAVGALAGDSLGYLIGHRFGRDLVDRWRWTRRLRPALRRARRHFADRGGMTVAVARWIGSLRAVVPVIAGAGDMRFARFVMWDAPSAVLWSTAIGTVGYVWGDDIADPVDRVGVGVSVAAVLAIAAIVVVARRRASGRGD